MLADAVQEFEAERGVKDTETEERASRSKDSGKRPSGNVTEDEEDEDHVRAKPKVCLAFPSYMGCYTER